MGPLQETGGESLDFLFFLRYSFEYKIMTKISLISHFLNRAKIQREKQV